MSAIGGTVERRGGGEQIVVIAVMGTLVVVEADKGEGVRAERLGPRGAAGAAAAADKRGGLEEVPVIRR